MKTTAEASALAKARITFTEDTNVATCNGSLHDHLTGAETKYYVDMADYKYTPTVNDECAESQAKCDAFAQGEALAEAASGIAAKSQELTKALCKLPAGTNSYVGETVENVAEAMASVLAKVRDACARPLLVLPAWPLCTVPRCCVSQGTRSWPHTQAHHQASPAVIASGQPCSRASCTRAGRTPHAGAKRSRARAGVHGGQRGVQH